jgi:SGNH hydrolase-like domain, acetyltransferase AlgX
VRRKVLIVLWAIAILVLATLKSSPAPFTFLERGSVEFWILLVAFCLTSISLFKPLNSKAIDWLHAALVLLLFLMRPRSAFIGRDGCLIILFLYLSFYVSVRFRIQTRWKILIISSLAALVLINWLSSISINHEKKLSRNSALLDYEDVIGQDNQGGFLKANMNDEWVGEFPHSRIVTDAFGFRTSGKTKKGKEPNHLRIIFIGDSFVVGLRTDQSQTIGALLQRQLQPKFGNRPLEVLLAGQDNPVHYCWYIEHHALEFRPDLILVGLTLGNDFSVAYLTLRGWSVDSDQIQPSFLPQEAYNDHYLRNALIKIDRTLLQWPAYELIRRVIHPYGIYSWNRDYPGRLSTVDVSSGLAYFYSLHPVPMIEQSFQDVFTLIKKMRKLCSDSGVDFALVIVPQRFQVNDDEWKAALFDYGLNENAFDRYRPNKKVLEFCDKNQIRCLDPTQHLRKFNGHLYFLRGDMHLNSKGQAAVANFLADHLVNRWHEQ